MVQIRSFDDAHQTLQKTYGSGKTMRYTLDRMRKLLEFLGNPQNDLRVVHVAGTSGKTSTAYYAAALLHSAGYKVGLTVSPHVDEVNERVQMDLVPLPEAEFCSALENFLDLVDQSGVKPSYFELMIALAFYEFRRRAVDYAVVEVGLGGLLDATNTISREDKVCIITDIGLDHVGVLGHDLATIAAQKAGIIQPHNHVFMYQQAPEIMQAVVGAADKFQANLHVIESEIFPEATALPIFQQHNFGLSLGAVSYMLERDGHTPLTAAQRQQAANTYIPARMEVTPLDNGLLIIDGAHNAQKLTMLISSIQAKFPNQPILALVAFLADRGARWQDALESLLPTIDECVFTSFTVEQGVPKAAVQPEELAAYCRAHCFSNWRVEADPTRAYQLLVASPQPVKLVSGSFYLLNDIRPLVRQHKQST